MKGWNGTVCKSQKYIFAVENIKLLASCLGIPESEMQRVRQLKIVGFDQGTDKIKLVNMDVWYFESTGNLYLWQIDLY